MPLSQADSRGRSAKQSKQMFVDSSSVDIIKSFAGESDAEMRKRLKKSSDK